MLDTPRFFDRDLSWLAFNGRVLNEAEREHTPLIEKIKFLSIFSSNLDEFYRVRMPVLLALDKLSKKAKSDVSVDENLLETAVSTITGQLDCYGKVLKECIIPGLKKHNVEFLYDQKIPTQLKPEMADYFVSQVMGFIQIVDLNTNVINFFPENNQLYFLVSFDEDLTRNYIINIPSSALPRFKTFALKDKTYIVFLDDIIRENLNWLFPGHKVSPYSFKITRNADIDLKDEYKGNLADEIEKQLSKRDFGLATRFLYQPGIEEDDFEQLVSKLNLRKANLVEGGRYHNLKDLADFPYQNPELENESWKKIMYPKITEGETLHEAILQRDILINPPYQSYESVLRFFNESATHPDVEEIYTTLYRVARDSKIVNALISASKNGKKVSVLVELKARFDEENNIKWAKKMKSAGIDIIYSVTALKVHAKIALVKRKVDGRSVYTGLLATGNFNETTANFYTDHILMTANKHLLREMELLFMFLEKKTKPEEPLPIKFKHLLVAQFNLQQRFLALIQREIENAKAGKPAGILIKLNNLEEKVLIEKLYEASANGVRIHLIIRGICRLVAGAKNLSENITVTRIVDRYLEHGRVFVFENDGKQEVYAGSADWMNRNIYRRIEVCFPIYDQTIKSQLVQMLNIQLMDNINAVTIDQDMQNISIKTGRKNHRSQHEIYQLLQKTANEQVLKTAKVNAD